MADILIRMLERGIKWCLVERMHVGLEDVNVFHFQFLDNTIFILYDDMSGFSNMLSLLHIF